MNLRPTLFLKIHNSEVKKKKSEENSANDKFIRIQLFIYLLIFQVLDLWAISLSFTVIMNCVEGLAIKKKKVKIIGDEAFYVITFLNIFKLD